MDIKWRCITLHKQRFRSLPYTAAIVDEWGDPAFLFDKSLIKADIRRWCEANCQHTWDINDFHVLFKHEDDAFMFKMVFSTK